MLFKVTQPRIQALAHPHVEGRRGCSRHEEQVKLLTCFNQGTDHPHRMPE